MSERAETTDKRAGLRALIFGATGLIGTELWRLLAEDERWSQIVCPGRKKPFGIDEYPKVSAPAVNLFQPETFAGLLQADVAFCCLGTTRKQAGSKEAFWRVDVELVTLLAEACARAGVRRMVVISAMGVKKNSMFFYNRAKATMEEQVRRSGIPEVIFVRPGLLLGSRAEHRSGESIAISITKAITPLTSRLGWSIPAIEAEALARAMAHLALSSEVPAAPVDNPELVRLGSRQVHDRELPGRP